MRGCTRVSPGCGGANHQGGCYAEKIAARFSDPGQAFYGFAERAPHGGRWTGKLALIEEQLDLPRRWKKPRRIFVNSMSDLFHEGLPDASIDRVVSVMAQCAAWRSHVFQVLTKRDERMRDYWRGVFEGRLVEEFIRLDAPLPNVWLGISVEDRARKSRIDNLRETPAAVRFLSLEPLLEDLGEIDLRGIGWVIAGAESGPRARPCDLNWIREIRDQCVGAQVPFFFKQHVERGRVISLPMLDGRRHAAFPEARPC